MRVGLRQRMDNLRSVIFEARQITAGQKANPSKIASWISSVCVSLFCRSSKDI